MRTAIESDWTNYARRSTKTILSLAAVLGLAAAAALAQNAPSIVQQPADQVVAPGSNALFSVLVGGSAPLTYQWQCNGTNLPSSLTTIIATVAGGGRLNPYSADGAAATNVSIGMLQNVAIDAAGNLFTAENALVRKVDNNGVITTVAGGMTNWALCEGGFATNAGLSYVMGVAVDGAGNLFIAEQFGRRVRKVDTNGIITTVAGNGNSGFTGDGGAATNATVVPQGLTVDTAGNLFIADWGNCRVRKVDTNGIITTVAGKGGDGSQYGSGDGGAATNAILGSPFGVACDTAGNLFIADHADGCIRKVDTNGIITTVAGNHVAYSYTGEGGAATNASLVPAAVALDTAGNLFIADAFNYRILQVDTNGVIWTVAGNGAAGDSGDGGVATNASFYLPVGVAVDTAGNLFIADFGSGRIREVFRAGSPTLTLPKVTASNAGNYSVIISNPYGSVTSAVATLTVPAPAGSLALGPFSPGTPLTVQVFGLSGYPYILQASTNLADWVSVQTNSAPFIFRDTNGAAGPRRFYRTVIAQ